MDEVQLREVESRVASLEALEARRKSIVGALESQGVFAGQLRSDVLKASSTQKLEDLYLPYRPKRATRSTSAKERGLAPLAKALISPTSGKPPPVLARSFLSKEVKSVEEALAGARDILAEQAAELPQVRELARETLCRHGRLCCKQSKSAKKDPLAERRNEGGGKSRPKPQDEDLYRQYYDFARPVNHLQPHQILAINRGEAAGILSVSIEWNLAAVSSAAFRWLLESSAEAVEGRPLPGSHRKEVQEAVQDGLKRLLKPAMERELRGNLATDAQAKAVKVFGKNLSSLLLQPPLPGKTVLGVDPAFRTGCKLAVVDPTGRLLEMGTVFPHPPAPADLQARARKDVVALMKRHGVNVVAIGNGTASRETEQFMAVACQELSVGWAVVNEAGASIYSASPLAARELPGIDVSLRGAVSIARRLQDPLSELVKIEPQHIGIGLYQHDMKEKQLAKELEAVVESAVNRVGIDANIASPALLAYVAGLGPSLAQKIVDHRDSNGPFASREALLSVKGIGQRIYEQCAGFLRVRDAKNALDSTPIHPESYAAAAGLIQHSLGKRQRGTAVSAADLMAVGPKLPETSSQSTSLAKTAKDLGVGELTLKDIIDALRAPGRDVRGAPSKTAIRTGAVSISEVAVGMQLTGVVRNVVAFGAFVDIGVGRDALLHRTAMKGSPLDPHSEVNVGDSLEVYVTAVDKDRSRLSVSMAAH